MRIEDIIIRAEDGLLIGKIQLQDIHQNYFGLVITFPDGTWRRHFVSYNALTPTASWTKRSEKKKKRA